MRNQVWLPPGRSASDGSFSCRKGVRLYRGFPRLLVLCSSLIKLGHALPKILAHRKEGADQRNDYATNKHYNKYHSQFTIIKYCVQFGQLPLSKINQAGQQDNSCQRPQEPMKYSQPKKRAFDKILGGPYQLHAFDDKALGINGQADRVVDQCDCNNREQRTHAQQNN